jgi:hypothetical protein
VQWTDSNGKAHDNGVAASSLVQFSGAADFPDDISVLWDMRPKDNQAGAPALPPDTLSTSGLLTVPDAAWIAASPNFLDWVLVVTSNRDHSKVSRYEVHFV